MEEAGSGLARWTVRLGAFACTAFLVGPFAAHFDVLSPLAGFLIFDLGGLVAVLNVGLGLVAVTRARGEERRGAALAFAACVAIAAVFAVLAGRARSFPRINDITTDTVQPPQFRQALRVAANEERDMSYPAALAAQQQAAYPDIAPLRIPLQLAPAFRRVREAARGMPGWAITREDPGQWTIEGTETSWLFRFRDDFVIELRPDGDGSLVHMRSKSRDGRGDLGMNARRIRSFFARLQGTAPVP